MKADSIMISIHHKSSLKFDKLRLKAKETLKKAEDLGDTTAEFYTVKGFISEYGPDANLKDAIDCLKIAIDKNPNCATAHFRLGSAYSMIEKYKEEDNREIKKDQ